MVCLAKLRSFIITLFCVEMCQIGRTFYVMSVVKVIRWVSRRVITQTYKWSLPYPDPMPVSVSVYTGHTLTCTLCIHCSGTSIAPVYASVTSVYPSVH